MWFCDVETMNHRALSRSRSKDVKEWGRTSALSVRGKDAPVGGAAAGVVDMFMVRLGTGAGGCVFSCRILEIGIEAFP